MLERQGAKGLWVLCDFFETSMTATASRVPASGSRAFIPLQYMGESVASSSLFEGTTRDPNNLLATLSYRF